MSEFLQRVENAVSQRSLLARGQKLLVAVSGGVDSMVLLHALHLLAAKHGWEMAVAHFNHRLRGRASDTDVKFVRQTAARLRWPFVGGDADVQQFAAQSKLSLEMAARKLRHEFLARAARARGIPTIVLAHHADDQVELFFLRLLRGAGGEGLAGMKWRSPSPADRTLSLVRPLLDFSKAELLAFARVNQIRFRDDATNLSSNFLRNRIRQELLPLLRKQYQPGLDQTVLRLMDIVGAEAEFVSAAARDFCSRRSDEAQTKSGKRKANGKQALQTQRQVEPPPGEPGVRTPASAPPHPPTSPAPYPSKQCAPTKIGNRQLPICNFAGLPIAVQRKVLQQQLTNFGLLPDFELVERLRAAPDKTVSVGAGAFAVRDAAGNVSCREALATGFDPAELNLKLLSKEGRAEFGGRRFSWRVTSLWRFQLPAKPRPGRMVAGPLREFFDADKLGDEIILRHWRPGDRFQPIGLHSAVKLQDLFVNAKIPPARRRELALAATRTGVIFWVEGLRIGEPFKLTPQTRRKLIFQCSRGLASAAI